MKPYSSQIWRIPTINWHRAQLAIVDKSCLRWNSKIVSDVTAPFLMSRGIERTFSRPFSETFRISKNEDFNGPYLENKNEFLKNSFETFFRASKSCDRGQLVSAFQLTFKKITRTDRIFLKLQHNFNWILPHAMFVCQVFIVFQSDFPHLNILPWSQYTSRSHGNDKNLD